MERTEQPYISSCPIGCGADFDISDIILPEGALKRCLKCGQLVSQCSTETYLDSMKEFEAPEGTWPQGDAAARLQQQAGRMVRAIERFSGRKRENIRLLDVGCSNGAFVSAAAAQGVYAEGVEPSAGPAASAVQKGLKVHCGFLEDLALPPDSFDAVTLFEVIEHLADPQPLMNECRRLLRLGGIMIIRTGNTASWTVGFMQERWSYFDIASHGGHVSFFNPLSMRRLAEKTGFKIIRIKTHSVGLYERGQLPPVFYRLAKLVSESLNAPARLFGRGDEMIVYLRKAEKNE